MSTVVIKQPSMRKLLAEQQQILVALPQQPSPASAYLSAPVVRLTSVYHSRGPVARIEDRPAEQTDGAAPLLAALLNAPPRVDIDVEKTLTLACEVLAKARCQSPEMTEEARKSLHRIMEIGSSFNALLPPPPAEEEEETPTTLPSPSSA